MIQLPIIGAFLEAAGMIIEKKILKKKNLNYKNYTAYGFLAIVILMLPILLFAWGLKPEAFETINILLMAFVVIVSVFANLLVFYSLKRENITEFEPTWLMQPLFTILLASIFYLNERNWSSLILALIASLSLILAHVKKHHLVLNKYIIAAIAGSFLFAVELVASKPILPYYNPFTFYFIRCFFIFIICFALFRPRINNIDKKTKLMVAAVALLWIFYRTIIYYGYENIGIVYTTTLFILSPVLMVIMAMLFLKEKPTLRQIISMIIIVACVVASVLLRN